LSRSPFAAVVSFFFTVCRLSYRAQIAAQPKPTIRAITANTTGEGLVRAK